MRMPPPRSKSPIKTFLQSPARRNPSLGLGSSPTRAASQGASSSALVRRRLDFSSNNLDPNASDSIITNGTPQTRGDSKAPVKKSTGIRSAGQNSTSDDEDDQDNTTDAPDNNGLGNEGDSFQVTTGGDDEEPDAPVDEPQEASDPEPEQEPEPTKKGRGKAKAKESEAVEEPPKKGKGRRKRDSNPQVEQDEDEPPSKRSRRSIEGAKSVAKPAVKAKASKASKATTADKAAKPKPKAAAKKSKLAPISEAESPEIQRGPPMPRNNRGLIILRRETPMEGNAFKQTRSGRNSIKPVAWWKNERIEYSEDENEYYNGGKFLLPRIKGVVRADEVEERRTKKSHRKPSKSKKPAAAEAAEDEDDEAEPWEIEPGRFVGGIQTWDPEDPTGVDADEVEEEIALSSAAIITRDVANASFRFAKTLSLPFFGSGMVDLPPGAVKKPKNSRMMQMVFFVFYGRVEVTVNGNAFRIGKGGMWQVPRGLFPALSLSLSLSLSFFHTFTDFPFPPLGNFYSISNDYDKPARIFFSQGCEVIEEATSASQ
jgi:centromere protein C